MLYNLEREICYLGTPQKEKGAFEINIVFMDGRIYLIFFFQALSVYTSKFSCFSSLLYLKNNNLKNSKVFEWPEIT